MSDARAPQDALGIASATTRRARSAPARSGWVPPVGALLYFGTFFLIDYTIDVLIDRTITVRGVAGIVVSLAFAAFMVRVLRAWRNGGVVPRPLAEQPVQRWKRVILGWLPPFVAQQAREAAGETGRPFSTGTRSASSPLTCPRAHDISTGHHLGDEPSSRSNRSR